MRFSVILPNVSNYLIVVLILMKKLRTISVFIFLLCFSQAKAQYESSPVWGFGHKAGIDFSNTSPKAITTPVYTHSAVSATQCDDAGNVLFYANGFMIWDADGKIMQGSDNPVWSNRYVGSWNLNAMIVPDGADTNRYFVFTTFPSKGIAPFGQYYVGQLTYTVVDMTLNGGKGGVVQGQTHILLDTVCGHYMTVVPGVPCKYWVVVQSGKGSGDYDFKTYEVGLHGVIQQPVVSHFGAMDIPSVNPKGVGYGVGNRAGNMIYSHTRNKLIVSYESADISAYDFDPATGKVSNAVALDWAYPRGENYSSSTIPAICLSPNEQLLYVSGYTSTLLQSNSAFILQQFPLIQNGSVLSVGTPITIFQPSHSQYLGVQQQTGFGWQKSAMQLGADSKIYHAFTMGQKFLGRINNPDVPGVGCNFVPAAMTLQTGSYTTSSLPAPMFRRKAIKDIVGDNTNKTICFQPSVSLSAPEGYTYYQWQNGWTSPVIDADTSGRYIVASSNEKCELRTDTFNVALVDYTLDLGLDIISCFDTVLQPVSDIPQGAVYKWQDGSVQNSFYADRPGTYWLTVAERGCISSDTVHFKEEELLLSLPDDTVICTGTDMRLDATVTVQGAAYAWHDGSTAPVYYADKAGVYTVSVSKGFCYADAATNLKEEYCDNCLSGVPNAFTPNNDGLNDKFKPVFYSICPIENYRFSVYNRFGQRVFHTVNHEEGWDGTFNGVNTDIGTYFYYLKFKGPHDKEYFHKGDVIMLR